MDAQDMLSNILNDPEKMKSIMSIASSFLGQNSEGGGAAPVDSPPPEESSAEPPQNESRSAGNFSSNSEFDPSAELIAKALPIISAIAKSGKNAINHDKMNLLLSLKPFVTNDVSSQMDHAIKVLSTARMAKAAINQIGTITGSNSKTEH